MGLPRSRQSIVRGLAPRAVTFWVALAAYLALTLAVLFDSPILDLDRQLVNLHLWSHHPGYYPWIDAYVMLGQRGPATLAFLPVFIWVAWRQRSSRPIVMLVAALVLLNVSVGVVKYSIGRVGPMHEPARNVHLLFDGGTIYPSGHVANAVVLYGLLAWLAPPRWRSAVVGAAVFVSVTVGLGTVYLRTHWFSDVVGGWLAGALVLLSLPTVMPYAQRWADRLVAWSLRRYPRLRWPRTPVATAEPLVAVQGNATPVSVSAHSQSRTAIRLSLDAFEERTRVG